MSHFTVMVIGPDPEEQLAPYHEFECTGRDDQYVQNINLIEEARQKFADHKITCLRDRAGNLVDANDAKFYRDPTPEELEKAGPLGFLGMGWTDGLFHNNGKINYVPEGYTKVEVTAGERETFADWACGWYGLEKLGENEEPKLRGKGKHKYGWVRVNDNGSVLEVIDRTNPNRKWDWYQLGGRWTGYFKMKSGTIIRTSNGHNRVCPGIALVGEAGLMTQKPTGPYADAALKQDIDFGAMRHEAGAKAIEAFEKFHAKIKGLPWPTLWPDVLAKHGDNTEAARDEYWAQPAPAAIRSEYWEDPFQIFGPADKKDVYVQSQIYGAAASFALIKDGQWFERGKMGFWGMVRDEKDKDSWDREFSNLLDSVPDDTQLSVFDCHI